MNETDAFFTQTIVGAPFSVLLGCRLDPSSAPVSGIEVNLINADTRLSRVWKEWIVMSHACDRVGQPRQRPARVRRWLERHALWLATLGVSSLLATAVFWGLMQWT
ncbi:MAG: hypothetical protein KGZ70_07150 [Hydrogenophaga sp.]|uniref:hypothetical protein n=1 Tax=Hydrogenophaga sp. TaxID=1904254 RepID=UPI001BC3B8D3|nr:hypothetical protein [Hydrogenophaga sp.]MBS3911591.1 hypothetical protein [Hydrogenophaga sp.]MDO9606306.1 hypothetical protein [Hydrogenophaga sp.]